jgi:hypothetical protein
MADIEEIRNAIAAHAMWKARLKIAIKTGEIDTPVETIRMNDQCDFGKWLDASTLTAADKSSDHYKTVRALHTEFHETAARVVELALTGYKREAENMMALNGEYTAISAKLIQAMMSWKTDTK